MPLIGTAAGIRCTEEMPPPSTRTPTKPRQGLAAPGSEAAATVSGFPSPVTSTRTCDLASARRTTACSRGHSGEPTTCALGCTVVPQPDTATRQTRPMPALTRLPRRICGSRRAGDRVGTGPAHHRATIVTPRGASARPSHETRQPPRRAVKERLRHHRDSSLPRRGGRCQGPWSRGPRRPGRSPRRGGPKGGGTATRRAVRSALPTAQVLRPVQLDTPRLQAALELLQVRLLPHGHRPDTVLQAPGRKGPRGLPGPPLDRVQPVAPVGDVRGADALARRQQVLHPLRHERPERDLEGVRRDVQVAAPGRAGVQVDPVAADADRVDEALRAVRTGAGLDTDVLL